jgi:nucleoside-triphosphatase
LSHVDFEGAFKVGKYRVDVTGFNEFLESVAFMDPTTNLVIIDEIGKMECLSKEFVKLTKDIMDSDKTVIATVAFKGGGVIAEIKKRPDVKLFFIKPHNRDSLTSKITAALIS